MANQRTAATERAISDIRSLYDLHSETGQRLLLDVILDMGFGALSDEAINALAVRHRYEHDRDISGALQRHRNGEWL